MLPYIAHNYWFLSFFILPPLVIFLGWRSRPLGILRYVATIFAGWLIIQFALDRHWEMKIESVPYDATHEEMMAASADGASRIFFLVFGWVPAGLYSTIWFAVWLPIWWFLAGRSRAA